MSSLHRLPYDASRVERPQAAGRAAASWTHRGNATKRVEVIMPPEKLDELREALAEAGILGMTVREAKVFDRGTGRREVYRGSSYVVEFTSKVEVVMVVQDDVVPRILEVLETIPGMGDGHDPSVFISEVVEAVRNRTGEQNGPRPILHGRHGP